MYVKGQKDGIFESCDRIRQNKDKEGEGLGSSRLANTEKCKEYAEIFGISKHYRQFVKSFTRIAKLLHEITRKDVKQDWEERQQKVFENLEKRFMIELVLVISGLDKKIRVEVDISDFAMKGLLSIKCENKKQRLVAYISKLLNKAKISQESV